MKRRRVSAVAARRARKAAEAAAAAKRMSESTRVFEDGVLLAPGTIAREAEIARRMRANRKRGFVCGHKRVDGAKACGFCALYPTWKGEFPREVNTKVVKHHSEEDGWYCSKGHMWYGVNSEGNQLCASCLWGETPHQPREKNLSFDCAVERETLSRKELYEKYGFDKPLEWRCQRRGCQHVFPCTFREFVVRRCPRCNNKRSSLELAFIETIGWEIDGWTITAEEKHKLPWCKFYADFTLRKGDKVLIVEIDGPQHFRVVALGSCVIECCEEKDRQREQYHLQRGEYVLRIAYNFPVRLWKGLLQSTLGYIEKNHLGASVICATLKERPVYDKSMRKLMQAVDGLTSHSFSFDVDVPHGQYCRCVDCLSGSIV